VIKSSVVFFIVFIISFKLKPCIIINRNILIIIFYFTFNVNYIINKKAI